MADEVSNATPAEDHKVAQDLEKEAQKKQAVPDSVVVNNAPIERGEYLKTAERHKEVAKQYGLPNYDALMAKAGSDPVFACLVINNLLTGDKGMAAGLHPDSPQENNLTGRIDRTVETPTRVKFDGQTDVKPVNA